VISPFSEVPVIEVRVLGPVEVTVDGAPADIGGLRQRCVLARLIAGQGRVVSADRLIEDLYSDEAPPRALAAVQSYVSHLRRALEPGRQAWTAAGVLVTSPPGYAIRLDRAAVDAWQFEDEVHKAAGLDDPAAAHDRLSAALAGWRGAAFQEFGGLAWADLEASRLDELRLLATEQLAACALRLGLAAQTVADLDRLTAEQPLREEGWRLLALALYQSGRQGDALATLRRARARLAAELGVDPGPGLRELEGDILAQAPHLSAPVATVRRAPFVAVPGPAGHDPPASADAYFGRDAELGQVASAARDAAQGRMQIVLVAGDAGAGKSALAGVASRRLAAEGWTVTTGRCPEHEGAPAGWPWAEALRRVARTIAPGEPQALAALLTDAPVQGGDAAAARFRLHRAVSEYLEKVSSAAPLLIVLEDLHRADAETLAILTDISADAAAARMIVLATYRPADAPVHLSECLAVLAGHSPAWMTLGGLDVAAAIDLVRATCTHAVEAATAQAIAERTGGNPFFIKETARLLDSEGVLAAASEIPAGVREVLQRRIARLPATAETVLRQASVLGTEADVGVLGEVAGVEEHVLMNAIDAGLLTGLVTEPAAGRIRFGHALVRDTLYEGLSRLRRSRLHGRAAEAIERHSPDDVAALAHHFGEAGTEPAKTARYCSLAAAQAEQRFAYDEAARLWEQAIAAVDRADGTSVRDRLELMLRLVGTLAPTEQVARARSFRRDAVRAALPLGDPVLLARLITAFDVPRAWYATEYGRADEELVSAVEQALATLPAGEQSLHCRLLTALAFELERTDSDRGHQASAEAVEMARRLGDADALAIAANGRVWHTFRQDGLAERLSLGAELLDLPGKSVTTEALGHIMLMACNSEAADFCAADRHADEAARIGERYDLMLVTVPVSFYRALRKGLSADLTGADDLYRRTAAQMDRLGRWRHGAFVSRMGRFCLRTTQGQAGEMVDELEPMHQVPLPTPLLSAPYALALAAAGRVPEARAVAARMPTVRRDMFWLLLTAICALVAIAVDDTERAWSCYQDLLPYAARPAGAETGSMTLWPTAQILGDLARYLRVDDAQSHYRHALAIAERSGVLPWREAAMSGLELRA
jgi:DNA-binding SARP family transcriptional activator